MNNFEFHKDAIEELFREKITFAVTENNVITTCRIGCSNCIFSTMNNPHTVGLSCGDRKMMWALQEYVEKPKLTKQERKFCELLEGKDCWFARDLNKELCLFVNKPRREDGEDMWWANTTGVAIMVGDDFVVFEIEMSFIKWEDEEPWSVDELLKLDVVE